MSCYSWNCRGLGNPRTVNVLKREIRREDPDIVFLMETKLQTTEMKAVSKAVDFPNCYIVDCDRSNRGRKGGLCLMWKDTLHIQVKFSSLHAIDAKVRNNGSNDYWRLTGIYGWPEDNLKERTWELIRGLYDHNNTPWLCIGDFNEILFGFEKIGGRQKDEAKMRAFRATMHDTQLDDLGFEGYQFTWTNGQPGEANIQERLDRSLANIAWVCKFPNYRVIHKTRIASDHSPIILYWSKKTNTGQRKRSRRFRFEKMWLQEESCKPYIKQAWLSSTEAQTPESINSKIHSLGFSILTWEAKHFGHIGSQITQTREQIARIQRLSATPHNLSASKKLENKLEELMKREETMWYQRARANWMKDGDKNTAFFHRTASGRKKRNTIEKIRNGDGMVVDDHNTIKRVFTSYFQNLFTSQGNLNMEEAIDAVERKVTDEHNEKLVVPFKEAEIIAALDQMHPTKSPGPDGMPALFYQQFWPTIKGDVIQVVLNILNNSANPEPLNNTHIVLIPKKKDPECPSDFRPISLCNVIFKLITKTIANRLKQILPQIIHPCQSAFVPGRLITDNALLAFEIFHAMKSNKAKNRGSFALKLDMSKAYDRVEWSFLERVLLKCGLNDSFVSLIMRCVTTVSYAVTVNGEPGPVFTPSRGLRQGDPLSPYLFLFCAESFSALIRRAESLRKIHGTRICKRAPSISHLFFADDSLIFGRANPREINEIRRIILSYGEASGQVVNFEKSEINFSKGVPITTAQELADQLEVRKVEKHSIYLGLPATVGRSKKEIFQGILDRVGKKLKDWKTRTLSVAGKLILIKSVAQAIPTYLMGCFRLPKQICDKLNSLISNFWWGQKNSEHRIHWTSWSKLCIPKKEGGLGFREIEAFNLAMLAKQGWRLATDENTLLGRTLKARYFPNGPFLRANIGYNPSFTWRSIMAGKEIIERGVRWRIGDGTTVRVWTDPWIPMPHNLRTYTGLEDPQDGLRVRDLMLPNGTEWDEGRVRSIFNEEIAEQVLKIPLRCTSGHDVLAWALNPNGRYSVRSGYKLAKQLASTDITSSSGDAPSVWPWIWSLKVPPKIQIFIWKAMHGILPTKANLIRRACDVYPLCERCHNTVENTEHALRDCPWSQFFWKASPLRIPGHILQNSHATIPDMIIEISKVKNEEYVALFVVLLWVLWYSRNLMQFQGNIINHQDCFNIGLRCLHDYQQVQGSLNTPSKTKPLEKWKKPQRDFLKVNTDASVRTGIGTGLGVVIRDHEGKIVRTLAKKLPHVFEIEVAEALACREGAILARNLNLQQVEFETDCLQLGNGLRNRNEDLSYLGSIMEDIQLISRDFASVVFKHIPRTANELAHKIASFAFDDSCNGFFSGVIPPDFSNMAFPEVCNPI